MSDIDYTFGNTDGPDHDAVEDGDKREDYRLSGRAAAVLELESELPEENGQPRTKAQTLTCRVRDLSAKGLCLWSPEVLTVGALLPAHVTLGQIPGEFTLTVEVVWCRPQPGSVCLVGAEIQNSDDTSYVEWVEAVAQVMTED